MSRFEPSIFRAYDMRGLYPSQMNEDVAYAIGQAYVAVMNAKTVVVGRDVRESGKSIQQSMMKGITDAGANAIDIGCISTEMLYFAAGTLDCDGGMSVTASHNPSEWNGTKFIGKGATPLTKDGDLGKIYDWAQSGEVTKSETPGTVTVHDILDEYVTYVSRYIPELSSKLKAVANANFGANGKVVDKVAALMPNLELVRMNWNEDGTFPKGTPDPLLPKNRTEISQQVVAEGADFGAAWDADADRAFFWDEKGRFFHGYYVNAVLIEYFLKRQPGAAIVSEPRLTWATDAAIERGGGQNFMSRVGHGFIKQKMRDHDAVYAGETSGHYYYKDFFFCDNGIITFLIVSGMFAESIANGKPVSSMLDEYMEKYPISLEELNYITDRSQEIITEAKKKFADAEINTFEGTSIEYPTWRCNIRVSSNEPIMRINIEAKTPAELEKQQTALMEWVASFGAKLRDDSH